MYAEELLSIEDNPVLTKFREEYFDGGDGQDGAAGTEKL
jgi:hypothetical protein